MKEAFQPEFLTKTPTGELNFIGAVRNYFDSYTQGFLDETKDTYVRDYNVHIFPHINEALPLAEYSDETIREILKCIQENCNLSDSTIKSRMVHLLLDPFKEHYHNVGVYENPLYGSALRFEVADTGESAESRLMKIKKSFSSQEEKVIAAELLNDHTTVEGVLIGLVLMFLSAARNAEACAFNFGDLVELREYPGVYFLRVYKTTEKDTNILKSGGKTTNAPRDIIIPDVLVQFILARKKYVASKITFPFTVGEVTYQTIDDMPIACRGVKYWERCDAKDLSAVGRRILRKGAHIDETDLSGINYLIQRDKGTDEDLGEREATTYLFRRNMATHLYTLGLNQTQIQFYMGHMLEETQLTRADFVDEEYLHEIWELLKNHPLNKVSQDDVCFEKQSYLSLRNRNETTIIIANRQKKAQSYRISLEGREWNDPLRICAHGDMAYEMGLCVSANDEKPGHEVNITKGIRRLYRQ